MKTPYEEIQDYRIDHKMSKELHELFEVFYYKRNLRPNDDDAKWFFIKGIEYQKEKNSQTVMDLLFALRSIKGKVTNKDLVKLARRIKS